MSKTEERGCKQAKKMLIDAVSDDSPASEWRTGYIQALESFLLNAYGIGSYFVPATYRFEELPSSKDAAI